MSLLFICAILFLLVAIMSSQVPTCSVCRIQWVQHADNCYLFRRRQMSWPFSVGYCKKKSSSLPVLNNSEEMDFLRLESKKHFDSHHRRPKYHKFWMGLKYDPSIQKWVWIDGTILDVRRLHLPRMSFHPLVFVLPSGGNVTKSIPSFLRQPFSPEEEIQDGCIYLQNGEFLSQQCSEDAYIICQAKVRLG